MDDALIHANLGELVSAVYETLIEEVGDPELASVATAAIVQDMLTRARPVRAERPAA